MNKTPLVASVLAFAFAGGLALTQLSDAPGMKSSEIQICNKKGCKIYSESEYKEVKSFLAAKCKEGRVLSWEESKTFVAVVNKEIKESAVNGKFEIRDVAGDPQKIKLALCDLLSK